MALFWLIAIALGSVHAQEKKSDPTDLAQDYRMVCEISKFKQNLLKTPEFKDSKPLAAVLAVEFAKVALRTSEAKKAMEVIIQVTAPDDKEKVWNKIASGGGLKTWSCPSVREL